MRSSMSDLTAYDGDSVVIAHLSIFYTNKYPIDNADMLMLNQILKSKFSNSSIKVIYSDLFYDENQKSYLTRVFYEVIFS